MHMLGVAQDCPHSSRQLPHLKLLNWCHRVIAAPETEAVEVERVLNQLQNQIARYRTLPPTWVREPSLASTR
ncbi:MAG: hypothetical protein WBE94_17195 [Pseudolabrys sp.]|jgi:hypothetical protein